MKPAVATWHFICEKCYELTTRLSETQRPTASFGYARGHTGCNGPWKRNTRNTSCLDASLEKLFRSGQTVSQSANYRLHFLLNCTLSFIKRELVLSFFPPSDSLYRVYLPINMLGSNFASFFQSVNEVEANLRASVKRAIAGERPFSKCDW